MHREQIGVRPPFPVNQGCSIEGHWAWAASFGEAAPRRGSNGRRPRIPTYDGIHLGMAERNGDEIPEVVGLDLFVPSH